jgi:hypothetical protein
LSGRYLISFASLPTAHCSLPLVARSYHSLDIPAHVKVALNLNAQRVTGFYEVFQNHVDYVLVKYFHFPKRIDVELQALQLHAAFVGNILKANGGEIRKVGKRTDGRKLRDLKVDFYFTAGEFVRKRIDWKEIHFRSRRRADIETLLISGRERAFFNCHCLLLN